MTLATPVDMRLAPSDAPKLPFWAWSTILHIGMLVLLSLLQHSKNIEPTRSVVKVTLVEATTSTPTPAAASTQKESMPSAPPQKKVQTPIEPASPTPILMKAQRPFAVMTQPTISIPRPLPTPTMKTTHAHIPIPSKPVKTVQTKPRRVLQDTRATDHLNLKNFLKVAKRSPASRTTTAQRTPQLDISPSAATVPPSLSNRSSANSNSLPRQVTPRTLTPNVLKAVVPGTGNISKSKVGLGRTIPPVYPRIAREAGWEGTVLIRVAVQPDGNPESVKIQKSSGHTTLDTAAIEAVKKWKFFPAKDGNIPIRSVVEIPIHFDLRNQQG